jgi:hypothetical protein
VDRILGWLNFWFTSQPGAATGYPVFAGNTGKMGIYKMADTEVFDYQAGAEEGTRSTLIFANH